MPDGVVPADILASKEILGRHVKIGIDEHFSYFKDKLYAEQTGSMAYIFKEMSDMGVTSHRFDFKWEDVEPKQGQVDQKQLKRLRDIAETAKQAGLENAIVLSHPPKWAEKLAKSAESIRQGV